MVLDGVVTSTGPGGPTNLPLVGAMVEVYATDANTGERRGAPLVKITVGADGRWGPLTTDAGTPLEFVVSAAGYATHHVYRSPFARSSNIVHLRPERLADSDRSAAAVVTFVRPRGYFGLPRDQIVFDNQNPAPGIPTGVAGVASSKLALSTAPAAPWWATTSPASSPSAWSAAAGRRPTTSWRRWNCTTERSQAAQSMQVFRGFRHPGLAPSCALTIGNFDGVHRGHQAMLALLTNEARHRGLASCVMTFEPHPRDYFAALAGKPESAPRRIATLRDKLSELERCGVEQAVVLRFGPQLSSLSPQAFIDDVLVAGLHARYVLVGDDFRFGAKRAGDYAMLDAAGDARGFDVARMMSYEVHGARVSSSAVRAALASRRHGAAPPRCSAGPTASAATCCTARSSAASSAFRP